jgi:hypothetical protein
LSRALSIQKLCGLCGLCEKKVTHPFIPALWAASLPISFEFRTTQDTEV